MTTVRQSLHALWAHESVGHGLRIFIALATVSFFCWHYQRLSDLPSFYLGIVACILGETDDYWWERLKAVVFLTCCFAVTTVAVAILFPYPFFFVIGMSVSVLGWTLLGALGERYSATATSIVAVAIFSMLNIDQRGGYLSPEVRESICIMLAGTLGYGLLTVIWTILFANRPVRAKLAQLMDDIAQLLELSAHGLQPDSRKSKAAREFALSKHNARVIENLDRTYTAIMSRFGRSDRLGIRSGMFFRLYALAQDAHERVHTFYLPNESLATELFHSDLLFRSQHLLLQLGAAFADLAQAIRLGQRFIYSADNQQACSHLRAAIDFVARRHMPAQQGLHSQLNAFENLYTNLHAIDQGLRESGDSKLSFAPSIQTNWQRQTYSLREMLQNVLDQLSSNSILFRFGLRLAVALAIGYLTIHLIHVANGYWVLMTIAFVCRPNYGATRLRVVERIAGTLLGLVICWIAIKLFPSVEMQLIFALLGALIFPITRQDHYIIATTAVTIMAIFCFNLIGDGLLVIWPRLIDTLIGCTIAGLATLVIFPDWHGRRLNHVCAHLLQTCADYLQLALHADSTDDALFRAAQRDMHNANAELSAVLTNMIHEPGRYRRNIDAGFNFLALSNTLIAYLIAIRGYRHRMPLPTPPITAACDYLNQSLSELATKLAAFYSFPPTNPRTHRAMVDALDQETTTAALSARDQPAGTVATFDAAIVSNELALLLRLYPKLEECAHTLIDTSVRSNAQTATV